jgi:DNA-binding transcriptional LysR family regulator
MALTLQQLRVLVAVAEHHSFTRGAQAAFMTQSAASQHVRALEGALGMPLLERAGGETVPTRAGEALLAYAREILRLTAEAEDRVSALRDGRAGRLVIGATGSAVYLAPALVAGFRAAHLGIEVGLEVLPRAALLAAVAQGAIDAALVAGPLDARPDLIASPLCPDRLVLAVPSSSALLPAAALGPIPLARLANETIVASGTATDVSASWRTVERWAAQHGVELRPALRLDGVDAVKKTVEAGIGVAFLSAWVVERELALDTLRVAPLDPPAPVRHFQLVRRRPRNDADQVGASTGVGAVGAADPALEKLLIFAPEYLARHVPALVGHPIAQTPVREVVAVA